MLSVLRSSDELFVTNAQRLSARIDTATRQINSGKRIHSVSDDPDQVGILFAARADLGRMEQIDRNLGQIKTEVDTAEGALQGALKLMDRASTLGAQGNTGVATAQSRRILADEIQSTLDGMVALSQTSVQGRFIFSGDNDQARPYESDISGYGGTPATRRALHPTGASFAIARAANEIWDNAAPERNVFASLRAMRDALAANDDDAVNAAMAGLRSAGEHLNEQLAFYGTAQGRVAEATEIAKGEVSRLRVQISGIEDTDLLAASLELNVATRDYQAALQARAKADRGSLFDYLG
jgi:flagellar hook-associated protein 3 FlgL